jgi:uncharacterized protein (TIGR02231 family)
MKNIPFLILFIVSVSALGQNDKKNIKSSIKEVTVFLNRAQISSTGNTHLEPGTTEIVVNDLSQFIDQQSIQVSGKGDFIIMSVKHSMNFLDQHKKTEEVLTLEDSIADYELKIAVMKNFQDVLSKEEQMIMKNQSIGGADKGVLADDLEDMADFFRDRLNEIKTESLKNDRHLKKSIARLQDFQNQYNALYTLKNQPTSKITITVSAKSATNAAFNIQYIVNQAGWYPVYDFRAKDTKSSVQVNYKAQVFQNTGMSWDKVKLKLSTANVSLGGTKPDLSPWFLQIYNPMAYGYKKRKAKYMEVTGSVERGAPSKNEDNFIEENQTSKPAQTISDYTQVTQTTLAAEFDISVPYTIPSDGVGQLVDIQNYDLPASFKYSAVPKMDKDAFLLGQVTGWEELNMISGNANIYFEGTYVGESYLDMQNTRDTLDLSLGRDSKVIIERKRLKEFTKKSFIGLNKREEFVFEITIRNTKKEAVNITIEDQVPVSKDSQIEVEVIDIAGAEYDKDSGKLLWKQSLYPAETQKIVFKYSVKYPKNKTVTGLY